MGIESVARIVRACGPLPAVVSRMIGGSIGLGLGVASAVIGDRNSILELAIPTGVILGFLFSPWIARGDSLERVAARMGVAAVLLGAALFSAMSNIGAAGFGVGLLIIGIPMLALTVPVAMTWAIMTRLTLRWLGLAAPSRG
jgi:hypothetical protein